MTLARKLIRQAAADLLTNATAAGANVVPGRILAPEQGRLPALSVFTEGEEVEEAEQAPRRLRRNLTLLVVAYVRTSSEHPARVDDQLDDLCEQVENALAESLRVLEDVPAELVEVDSATTILEQVELGLLETAGRPMAGAQLRYRVTYYTRPGQCGPEDYLPWLEAGVEWDLAPPDQTLEATDTTELPQD